MSMQWFRVYSEIKDDPKMLALTDQQFRIWMNLLAMASMSKDRGIIPKSPLRGLAAALHTTEEILQEALATFQNEDFLLISLRSDGAIIVTRFVDRQYDYPSDTPDATRERKRKQRELAKNDMSRIYSNDVTNTSETDTDSDTDNKKNNVCVASAEKSVKDGARQMDCAKTATEESALTVGKVAGIGEYTPEFEAFWAIYPLKKEKKAAYKAWRARLQEKEPASSDMLTAAAKKYADECRKNGTESRFIKHGATFLGSSKPYEDYIPRPKQSEEKALSEEETLDWIKSMV